MIAGGVESMTPRALCDGQGEAAFSRGAEIDDTTIGWRFVNALLKAQYGVDAMPETAENVAAEFGISREDQDAFALRSQQRTAAAQEAGIFASQIVPVTLPGGKAGPVTVARDEHPRATSQEALAKLKPIVRPGGTVTAGNAAGINDGAAAVVLATAEAADRHGLTRRARIRGTASAGVPPRIMGIGPVPAMTKLLDRLGLSLGSLDVIELNEAFAAQVLACLRQLGLPDDAAHVNPHGGAIALGHPLGMSGARIAMAAVDSLGRTGGRYAVATMCVGVGQGVAMAFERVG